MSNKILFVGALKSQTKDKSVGGLYTACHSLSKAFKQREIKIIELNTTYRIKSVGSKIPFFKKATILITRNIYFIFKILFSFRAKSILIFVSAGNSYYDKAPSIFISKLLGKKILTFPRSGFLLRDYENKKHKKIIDYVLSSSDIIVCQSDFWKEYFITKNIPEDKLIVQENWILDKLIEDSKQVNFKSLLDHKTIKIVYVSRIEKLKGVDDMLDVAIILKEKGFDFEVSIYGDGVYLPEFEEKVKNSNVDDHVILKGWLAKDKISIINEYDLVVFPSRFEGYPNSLMDFILAKVPVIVSNIGSVKAVGKDYMLYYQSGDAKELADKIIYAVENYDQLIVKSKKIYKEKTEQNTILKSAEQIIKYIYN